jgi:hypothetical protein
VPSEALKRALDLDDNHLTFDGIATDGVGVFDTLKAIISQVITRINKQTAQKSPTR